MVEVILTMFGEADAVASAFLCLLCDKTNLDFILTNDSRQSHCRHPMKLEKFFDKK